MVDYGVEAARIEEGEVMVGEKAGEGKNCIGAVRRRREACHLNVGEGM